jgi:LacI family transcriptional regulator
LSLQLLAHALGLSESTVSRALNGYADVSAKTRLRVREAAVAMNYQPHPLAHRLATGRTGAIALVTSVRAGNYLDATFAALMSGAADTLRQHNYFALSVVLPAGDAELPELERFLAGRLVDGVILARTRTFDARVALLQERQVPFVTHGRTESNLPHAWLDTDNEEAFYGMTRRLIALGHRRLALVNGPAFMTYAVLRRRGFIRACDEAGIALRDRSDLHTEVTSQAGEAAAAQLLHGADAPTALVCATDAQALGAMAACRALGFAVGQDVAVTGYGNTEAGAYAQPPLTTIDHAIVDNGRHLADMMLRLIAGDSPQQINRLEPVQLIERASACAFPHHPGEVP